MSRFFISCALAVLLLAVGCDSDRTYKYNAQGAPYEIVVVADHDVWNGPTGDTLRTMFYKKFPMVNREEPYFDVLRVLPSGFTRLVKRHRNVMIADIDTAYRRPTLSVGNDVYSQPQIVLTATAPDMASLVELVTTNRENIMLALENAEKDRDVADARGHTPQQIASLIREKFGFEMSMGPGYMVRSENEDFLWLDYRMPTADQGIVIYTYPFSGVKDFDRENLLSRRNEFMARIPGENPGSHMISNPDYVGLSYKTISGRPWAELYGFWDVKGDFMGGPYRNYSTLDAANQRVIAIDFYVLCPDQHLKQRNYIKQLEHFLYTVKISGQSPAWEDVKSED